MANKPPNPTGMLILTRRIGEEICIGDDVRVRLLRIDGNQARLGGIASGKARRARAEKRRA